MSGATLRQARGVGSPAHPYAHALARKVRQGQRWQRQARKCYPSAGVREVRATTSALSFSSSSTLLLTNREGRRRELWSLEMRRRLPAAEEVAWGLWHSRDHVPGATLASVVSLKEQLHPFWGPFPTLSDLVGTPVLLTPRRTGKER